MLSESPKVHIVCNEGHAPTSCMMMPRENTSTFSLCGWFKRTSVAWWGTHCGLKKHGSLSNSLLNQISVKFKYHVSRLCIKCIEGHARPQLKVRQVKAVQLFSFQKQIMDLLTHHSDLTIAANCCVRRRQLVPQLCCCNINLPENSLCLTLDGLERPPLDSSAWSLFHPLQPSLEAVASAWVAPNLLAMHQYMCLL